MSPAVVPPPAAPPAPEADAPAWLAEEAPAGPVTTVAVRARGLTVRLWSPSGAADDEPLALLVCHDGAAYEDEGGLCRWAAALQADGRLPGLRVALVDAAARDEAFSASALHARALCERVLPAVAARVAVRGRPVAMGASLGALAALHAHRRHPGRFAGLFLQSGSYFVPRFDRHESGFRRYGRIVRFVRCALREERAEDPVPLTMTCAREEENVHNNRLLHAALERQGHEPCTLALASGGHDYPTWRAALHPHLTDLLQRAFG